MIVEKFDVSIYDIENSNLSQIDKLKKQIDISHEYLQECRSILKNENFTSNKDEINFFKYQKPHIQGKLAFYRVVKDYLIEIPNSTKVKQCKFINNELNKIDDEKCKYLAFIKYYRDGKRDLDHFFFLRGNDQFELFLDNFHHYDDPEFTTRHDYIVSKMITNKLLVRFYNDQLDYLQNPTNQSLIEEKKSMICKIPWTGSITELVENTIALNAAGSIGNGNLSLNQIQEICINSYDINPGNIYKIFEQIKARKSNQTKFLDKLTKALINEISSQLKKL